LLFNMIMLYTLIWGTQGVIAYNDLKSQYKRLQAQIASLDNRNIALSREIRLLQSDGRYIEKMVRKRMNFVREDEILYIFSGKASQGTLGAAPDERED